MQQQVTAILLAAGSAKRMGRLKQLLPLGGWTVIEHCIGAIVAAGVSDIVVVLGPDAAEITPVIHAYPVATAFNMEQESGMVGSARAGLHAASPSSGGILICLVDHPLVMPETMASLISLHRRCPDSIIVPSCDGRRGHPTLFPRETAQEIYGAVSLRDVIEKHSGSITYLDTNDEGILLDMDTPDDYDDIRKRFGMKESCPSS